MPKHPMTVEEATAEILAVIAFARREHAAKAKQRESSTCASKSSPPKSTVSAAA
jgi:hypothetical protein